MNFHILTLFPDMVMQGLSTSITGRALQQNKIGIHAVDIRDYADNKHRKVDDYTYGGGAGMLMQAQPVYDAWASVSCASVNGGKRVRTIYVTPQGRRFDQHMAEELAKEEELIILCGHYEGIDQRVLDEIVTDEVSIGDYVLTGGEHAAMVIVDAVVRLVPGVLHNQDSAVTETFSGYLLEYPQYSRPEEWHGKRVPEVLLSGNERRIRDWRLEQSKARTRRQRPDLYDQYDRLQECKALMMRQKILHIDMIELINRNRAELLFREGGEILLRETETGICFHTRMDCPTGAGVQSAGKTDAPEAQERMAAEETPQFYKRLSADLLKEITCIIAHQESCARELEARFGCRTTHICYQSVCTRREQLPVSGLYRTDGAPVEDGINQGMQIRQVPPEYEAAVSKAYHPEHEEEYIHERIAAGAIYGAFFGEELAGFIGFHSEGSIGMLEVLPEYRGRHIATALATYMSNLSISRGMIPYGQVIEGNEISMNLQRSIGQCISGTPVFWMERTDG